ncbi:hypothetical protein C9422_09935 [Pseudomonas sp. B1(2018)]|nr:hypothetical protein C9422_09935 [Pseudomonas sp. B1(2018)]
MVSTAEKYAIEIEIFTLSRGFRAQISRSYAQKRRFQWSVCGQSGRTDFFNTIGQKLPLIWALRYRDRFILICQAIDSNLVVRKARLCSWNRSIRRYSWDIF